MELHPDLCSHPKLDARDLNDLYIALQRGVITCARAQEIVEAWLEGRDVAEDLRFGAPIDEDPDSPRIVLEWLISELAKHSWTYPQKLAKIATDALSRSDTGGMGAVRLTSCKSPDYLDRAYAQLETMSDEDRLDFTARLSLRYCTGCGVDKRTCVGGICHCQNDE